MYIKITQTATGCREGEVMVVGGRDKANCDSLKLSRRGQWAQLERAAGWD